MTKRLLIYGDSNSYGTAPQQHLASRPVHPPGARWGDVLASGLGEDWDVVIEGLPGRTTVLDDPVEGAFRNGLTVLPAILHSHEPIDVLAICLGTNDQKHVFGRNAQDIALCVARLVREARLSGTVGVTLAIAPPPLRPAGDFAEMFSGAEERGEGLPDRMARFAGAEGAAFFDAGTVIEVDPLDGIHWSESAHDKLGRALIEVVKELVKP